MKKILVVDNNNNDIKDMIEFLGEHYSIESASNGAEALDLIKTSKFDLILVDILMPTLSGYDLVRLLRERINGSSKVAYISIVPKNKVPLDNVDGFIQKPFSKESLFSEVKKLLK